MISPHVRESIKVLDSGFPASGFRIPTLGFRIPTLWIPDSNRFGFRIPTFFILNISILDIFKENISLSIACEQSPVRSVGARSGGQRCGLRFRPSTLRMKMDTNVHKCTRLCSQAFLGQRQTTTPGQ